MPDTGSRLPPAKQPNSVAIRLFFVDKETGKPVFGVLVSVFAGSSRATDFQGETTSQATQRQTLASLQTDQFGYVSFKFDRSIVIANSQLVVRYGTTQGDALVLDVTELLAGSDIQTIQLSASTYATVAPHLALPSIISPDIRDLSVSPGSIGLVPQLLLGRGLCRQLMPTSMGVRRFEAFVIRADICNLETTDCGDKVQIARGQMLEYEIAWHPAGTALGDLLNTIPLAPCEQVNVVIADWTRRETASQTQATEVQQQSLQEMTHDRLIVETMQSSISAKSSSWGVVGSAKATIPLKKLDLTTSLGGGYARSTLTQNVALNATNQLSEHITQAASFVASKRSTVVFQATATEHQTYQTRTVRNHNHCHTLTLTYYQVNRSYRVVTDYKGERDVILVKCDNVDFDASRAYCHAELLRDALLDKSLLSCFDELADALFCCDKKPVGKSVLMDSITLSIKLAPGSRRITRIQLILNTANGPITVPWTPVSWQAGNNYTQTFTLPAQVDPKEVTSIVALVQTTGNIFSGLILATDIVMTYHAIGYSNPLALASVHTTTNVTNGWSMEAKAELPPITEGLNPCIDSSCCSQKLLGHFNCHKRYYNSILWLNEDPNERVMRWSCCVQDGQPFSLISQIENDPIAVYGDFLVFAAAGSQLVDDPAVLPVSKLVTMPTQGVYTEGILGQCDTCEKIDPDRFWNWKDSPCPDNAPTASVPATHQTGVKPDDLKAEAISNLITFSNVPGAPDSIIKDLIAGLIAKADTGSSAAKDLLGKLLDAIKESLPKSSDKPPAKL
ncbi:MAG TPA: hypothetical protein VEX43_05750 [Chthoniobacterales bacterium]|nr:hypothetical protein [Chthoniobacterales bacterium]